MIGVGISISLGVNVKSGGSGPVIVDPNAQAFITAAGITNPVQQSAIDNLVIGLKADGLWTQINAIYPFVGGTASTHKYNLKDPRDLDAAFRIYFGGGWTHNANGAIGNAVNTYADTYFLNFADGEMGIYNRANFSYFGGINDEWEGGDYPQLYRPWKYVNSSAGGMTSYFSNGSDQEGISSINTSSTPLGLIALSGNNSISRLYKNGIELGNVAPFQVPNSLGVPIWLGGISNNGRYGSPFYGNSHLAFGFITTTVLNGTQNTNLYTRVQTFNQALSRQVGVPIVSDADAQAFLNSAEITNVTEANAINTLVTDLKAQGLWNKMKAIYPFVGGTATAHKYNLKDPRDLDAAFRLVFNGGWTHSAQGATPNGTNGYADTRLVPNTQLTLNNVSFSAYSRNNFTPTNDQSLGCSSRPTNLPLLAQSVTSLKVVNSYIYSFINPDTMVSSSGQNLAAMFITTRTAANNAKSFRNTTQLAAVTTQGQTTQPTNNFFFGAFNGGTGILNYSSFQYAFAHIGDGLTDTEAANLYTSVQAFQTSLSRQV